MRIALLTRRFDPAGGGTERDLMVTADCLRRGGYEVATYADDIRGGPQPGVYRIGSSRLPRTLAFLRFAFAAAPAARRYGADLVLSFARVVNADVLRSGGSAHASYLRAAARWRGRVGAAAMRLAPYHLAQVIVERRGFTSSRLRGAIAVSEFVRRDLMAQFGLPAMRVRTIYNGVDLDRFRPSVGARPRIRERFHIPDDRKMVLFVGNGFARKGLGFLIDALAKVRDVHLLVVGSDRAASSFERRAQRNGVRDRVVFAGNQPDVAEFFSAADTLALPSLFEPFGNVAIEAMACGSPALVSTQCGAAEVMPPALRDYVIRDPADSAEIAQKLDAILKDAKRLRPIARAAALEFTWDRHARQLNQYLGSLR